MVAYFPASGGRDRPSGTLIVVGANGHSWSSSSRGVGQINGSNLGFGSGDVNALNNNSRGYGLQVRCVQELTILYKEGTILARSIVE